MASGTISKRSVDAFHPTERDSFLWDEGRESVKGFGLKVTPAGRKVYLLQYRVNGRASTTRRITIGAHGVWTPEAARTEAKRLARMVEQGIDPVAEREERERNETDRKKIERDLAFDEYCTQYLEKRVKVDIPRSYDFVAGALRNHAIPILKSKPLPLVVKRDIVTIIEAIPVGEQSVRRSVFAVLRKLFRWAKSREDIAISPLDGMEPPKPVASRDRVLGDQELALALRAADSLPMPFGPFYRFLFATGQRREEVAGLNWAEVNRDSLLWTIPAGRTKNNIANVVPLNRHALAALDRAAAEIVAARAIAEIERAAIAQGAKISSAKRREVETVTESAAIWDYNSGAQYWPVRGLVFSGNGATPISGFSRAKTRLDAIMLAIARDDAKKVETSNDLFELAPWRLHDARRTVATGLQRLGVRFEVTEAVLNHTSGASRTGVAAVYQRHGWGPEKRAALDAWADHCDQALSLTSQHLTVTR